MQVTKVVELHDRRFQPHVNHLELGKLARSGRLFELRDEMPLVKIYFLPFTKAMETPQLSSNVNTSLLHVSARCRVVMHGGIDASSGAGEQAIRAWYLHDCTLVVCVNQP
jgi:hypothetical protein